MRSDPFCYPSPWPVGWGWDANKEEGMRATAMLWGALALPWALILLFALWKARPQFLRSRWSRRVDKRARQYFGLPPRPGWRWLYLSRLWQRLHRNGGISSSRISAAPSPTSAADDTARET